MSRSIVPEVELHELPVVIKHASLDKREGSVVYATVESEVEEPVVTRKELWSYYRAYTTALHW
jgi:hypothetical protein